MFRTRGCIMLGCFTVGFLAGVATCYLKKRLSKRKKEDESKSAAATNAKTAPNGPAATPTTPTAPPKQSQAPAGTVAPTVASTGGGPTKPAAVAPTPVAPAPSKPGVSK